MQEQKRLQAEQYAVGNSGLAVAARSHPRCGSSHPRTAGDSNPRTPVVRHSHSYAWFSREGPLVPINVDEADSVVAEAYFFPPNIGHMGTTPPAVSPACPR